MSVHDPYMLPPGTDASTRRWIAYGICAVFATAMFLVFLTLWLGDNADTKGALALFASVVGVFGTVIGYYFAKGD